MERGISLSSVDRSVLESNPVRQTFWELHRQLAECYVQDTTDGIAASADLGYRNRHLTVPEKGEKKFSYDGARSPPLLALNIRTLLDEHYVGRLECMWPRRVSLLDISIDFVPAESIIHSTL